MSESRVATSDDEEGGAVGAGDQRPLGYPVQDRDARWRSLPDRAGAPRYLWSGLALVALGALLALVVVIDQAGLNASDLPYNRSIFELAHRHIALEEFAAQFQVLGSGNVTAPVAFAFGLLLGLLRRWHWLVFFAVTSIGGLLISEALKNSVQRARPTWSDAFFSEHGYSFPSGHTLSGVTTWVAMGVVVMFIAPRPWSSVLGWLLVGIGVAMGPSRWLYGVHWITDVLGAWLLGFGWLLVVAGWCLGRWGPDESAEPESAGLPAAR